MIRVDCIDVYGWEASIRGMRNPYNSWLKSDTDFYDIHFSEFLTEDGKEYVVAYPKIGEEDMALMKKLAAAGDDHGKFLRFINVTMDITAPFYWWKEYDTYKVGTVANSCSTMHKIMDRQFELDDFSFDRAGPLARTFRQVVNELNDLRYEYLNEKNEREREAIWNAVIQILPENYMQKRTVQLNYMVLKHIYKSRKGHKLSEWHEFREVIEKLPYSHLITGEKKDE